MSVVGINAPNSTLVSQYNVSLEVSTLREGENWWRLDNPAAFKLIMVLIKVRLDNFQRGYTHDRSVDTVEWISLSYKKILLSLRTYA